jgi:hypothetical protein
VENAKPRRKRTIVKVADVGEALKETPRWAVYQCVNGCLHLRLERQTLTFSAPEFAELVQLLGDASLRLAVRATAIGIVPH